MMTVEQMIEKAAESAATSKFGTGIHTDGRFQVYVVPVAKRLNAINDHYRATFYLKNESGDFKRVSREMFTAAIKSEAQN